MTDVNSSVPPYDTIAIDSFSKGAMSIDVAKKIKMSSVQYQDSLRAAKIAAEQERLLKKAADDKEEAENKVAADLKKKDAGTTVVEKPAEHKTGSAN